MDRLLELCSSLSREMIVAVEDGDESYIWAAQRMVWGMPGLAPCLAPDAVRNAPRSAATLTGGF